MMKRASSCSPLSRGFTLVELIMVVVITSIIAVSLAMVIRPAATSYMDSKVRAELSDQADTALRRMLRDVRQAVPNSIRISGTQCFELVPTIAGGRYRMAPDTVRDAACAGADCSVPLDPNAVTSKFDSLTPLTAGGEGDWVVINNQNTSDVYSGVNRAEITAVENLAPAGGPAITRVSIVATQFPTGYDGGRFQVIPKSQQAVFYFCDGADGSVDSNGHGKGVLYRAKAYGFNATQAASCPSTLGADVVARGLTSCMFVYDPTHGATQQSGYIWMQLTLTRNRENATLAVGAHVLNTP